MAPNKKSLAQLVETLSSHDLTSMIKSEYLPLTHAKAQDTLSAVVHTEKPTLATQESDDYWNWTAPAEMDVPLSLEEATRLTAEETIAYWDEPMTQSTSDCYWDWSVSPHAHVLTASHVESNLLSFVAPVDVVRMVHASDSGIYWDMTSAKDKESKLMHSAVESTDYWYTPNTNTQVQAAILTRILQDESIRHLLSAEHLEEQLQQCASDAYWQWGASNSITAVSMGPIDYWDM